MKLVERYIYAVTRRLPHDQREDVANELRGMIEDALDERGSRSKKNIEEVLLSLGDPELFAQKYKMEKPYVIGPSLYPLYVRTLKLVLLWAIPISFIIQLINQMTKEPAGIIELIAVAFGMTISIGIYTVFFVTLMFFILDRSGVRGKDVTQYTHGKTWDPSMLPELPRQRQIPLGEVIMEGIWYGLLTLLPFIATRFFIGAHTDGEFIPFFNPDIWHTGTYIVMAFGIVGLAQTLAKYVARNWNRALAAFTMLYAIAFSAFLILAFAFADVVNPEFLSFMQTRIDNTTLSQVTNTTNWIIAISVGVTVLTYLYEAGKRVVITYRN